LKKALIFLKYTNFPVSIANLFFHISFIWGLIFEKTPLMTELITLTEYEKN
jgi:hypothetical protein